VNTFRNTGRVGARNAAGTDMIPAAAGTPAGAPGPGPGPPARAGHV